MRWSPASPAAPGDATAGPRRVPTRDRRGRGPRGPIAPPAVPITRSRSERFNELVLDAVERLDQRWRAELAAVVFAVEDVPPLASVSSMDSAELTEPVPLARVDETADGHRIVVHRWPIEVRTRDPAELAALVHDVVVEEVAEVLGVEPEVVDPHYDADPPL